MLNNSAPSSSRRPHIFFWLHLFCEIHLNILFNEGRERNENNFKVAVWLFSVILKQQTHL
jgi:hypothetical protein